MERRDFLKKTGVTVGALYAAGQLPLLAATKDRSNNKSRALNIFTEPAAIEPITGQLGQFTPAEEGTMRSAFAASYALIYWRGSKGGRSRGDERGSIDVQIGKDLCQTTEKRQGNTVKTRIKGSREPGAAFTWKLDSVFDGPDSRFVEEGAWDGKKMTVASASWKQERDTKYPLTHKWALLPMIASGSLKNAPLKFDMLDDSTLRPDQELRYEGQISVPVKGGTAQLDSYIQTGRAIQPIHYLVDSDGRVQLITSSIVNWTLRDLK